jgi:hypothetical protein
MIAVHPGNRNTLRSDAYEVSDLDHIKNDPHYHDWLESRQGRVDYRAINGKT